MPYQFATEDQDYSDYASGRVIYSQPNAPAFPIRLTSEIIQNARAILGVKRLALYDPTCGGAYHLCALGFLHGEWISSITASDIDEAILDTARRNLNLLSEDGLEHRTQELRHLLKQFGKQSHADALNSAEALRRRLHKNPKPISTHIFEADAFDSKALLDGLAGQAVDLIFSDIPYGQMTNWKQAGEDDPSGSLPLDRMLDALLPCITTRTILAIASDKRQKPGHPGYRRLRQMKVGKRLVTLLTARP